MADLKPDISIYEDMEGDEDLGAFRGPLLTRQPGESYADFRERVLKSAQFIVDTVNAAESKDLRLAELETKVKSLQAALDVPVILELETKVKNLSIALAKYADKTNWSWRGEWTADDDPPATAREALGLAP